MPVPYFHLVFTLPHALNPLIRAEPARALQAALRRRQPDAAGVRQNRSGAQLGITAVLHTWSQTLVDHYHLHCIVTGGGLARGQPLGRPRPALPLCRARSEPMFRGKFCAGLERALRRPGSWSSTASSQPWAARRRFTALLRQATQPEWVVYAKRPFAGPEQVLAYLSRYTHRVAISPRRLLWHRGDRNRDLRLEGLRRRGPAQDHDAGALGEFVRRFCLHLLPERFVKIRHYGLLGNHCRKQKIEHARRLLASASPALRGRHRGPTRGPCGSDPVLGHLPAALPAVRLGRHGPSSGTNPCASCDWIPHEATSPQSITPGEAKLRAASRRPRALRHRSDGR